MDRPKPKVRDSATIIILDRREPVPKVLMGRRASAHAFMPNLYVFPGGRVDMSDRYAPISKGFDAVTEAQLLHQMRKPATALKAKMLGACAIRETYEEVGLMIGSPANSAPKLSEPTWQAFQKAGLMPDFSQLRYLARAITPPDQNRRFDTRFFVFDASGIIDQQHASSSHELEDVRWVSLDQMDDVQIPFITGKILEELEKALKTDAFLSRGWSVTQFRPGRNATADGKHISKVPHPDFA